MTLLSLVESEHGLWRRYMSAVRGRRRGNADRRRHEERNARAAGVPLRECSPTRVRRHELQLGEEYADTPSHVAEASPTERAV